MVAISNDGDAARQHRDWRRWEDLEPLVSVTPIVYVYSGRCCWSATKEGTEPQRHFLSPLVPLCPHASDDRQHPPDLAQRHAPCFSCCRAPPLLQPAEARCISPAQPQPQSRPQNPATKPARHSDHTQSQIAEGDLTTRLCLSLCNGPHPEREAVLFEGTPRPHTSQVKAKKGAAEPSCMHARMHTRRLERPVLPSARSGANAQRGLLSRPAPATLGRLCRTATHCPSPKRPKSSAFSACTNSATLLA
jgi:hypothetical protein